MTAAHSRPDPIDRITPTRLPSDRTVMYQRWAHLLFLHWATPPETLQSLIPPGLDLDTFEGQAYVGLVPFTMKGVRPVGVPALPGLSAFHETNVRTYVHRQGCDPGVCFFSLDAANALAVRVARAFWKLPYHFARMALSFSAGAGSPPRIHYRSERLWPGPLPAACALSYTPTGTPAPAIAGTLEHFLIERYILYSTARGRLYSGRVHHAPYPVQSATVSALEESLLAAAGITRPAAAPLAHYASEVRVRIYPLHALNA